MRKLIGIIAAVIAVSFLGGVSFAVEPIEVNVSASKTQIVEFDCCLYEVDTTKGSSYMYMGYDKDGNVIKIDNVTLIENSTNAVSFGAMTERKYENEKYTDDGTNGPELWTVYLPTKYICVVLYPSTSGQKYELSQQVISASPSLQKALIASPGYCSEDRWWPVKGPMQGTQPADSVLYSAMPAWGDAVDEFGNPTGGSIPKVIYTSGSRGLGRMIRCYYGIASGNTVADKYDANGCLIPVDPEGVAPLNGDDGGDFSATITFTLTTI